MARRACLAIGVSNVAPAAPNAPMRFGYLDGAVQAARAIGAWALYAGFGDANVRIVEDEQQPVTEATVQQAVEALFPPGAEPVDHLIVAFCGHGLTDANVWQMSWLFSDAEKQRYRVLADLFCDELMLYGVRRLTLISDACREAPKELDLLRWEPRRGLTAPVAQKVPSPRFDKFAACQDGALGYMVKPQAGGIEPGKCIFSGVVADALWGQEPTAIDANGAITTATFGVCVEARTAERAMSYQLTLNPQCSVHPAAAVLWDTKASSGPPPALQPWPPAPPPPPRPRPGLGFGLTSGGPPRPPRPPPAAESPDAEASREVARGVQQSLAGMQPAVAQDDDNLVVSGGGARVWSAGEVRAGPRTADSVSFGARRDAHGLPLLVEFEDGAFAPVVAYQGLFTAMKRGPSGQAYLAYGHRAFSVVPDDALDVITRFAAGDLAVGQIDQLAGHLRQAKHEDPALGAICAHLYRAVGDFDSIRRMAYFYAAHDQPVPFDIALLGEMTVTGDAAGALTLHIPDVPARAGPPADPPLPDYVTGATTKRDAAIGGRCPWLGLGWDYVGLVREEAAPLVAGLAQYAPDVSPSGFTVLPRDAGRALAALWGLTPR